MRGVINFGIQPLSSNNVLTNWMPALLKEGITDFSSNVTNLFQYSQVAKALSSEEPFYFQALEEPDFQRYHAWCSELRMSYRKLLNTLVKKEVCIAPQQLRNFLLSQLGSLEENILSPFYYQQQLKKVEEKIQADTTVPDIYAKVMQEVCVRLEIELKENIAIANSYFYNELMNHVIEIAGNQVDVEVLQAILAYYQGIVDKELYEAVEFLVENFIHGVNKFYEKQKDASSFFLPNPIVKTFLQAINNAFIHFDNNETNEGQIEESSIEGQQNFYNRFSALMNQIRAGIQTNFHYVQENPKAFMTAATVVSLGAFYSFSAFNGNTITPTWTSIRTPFNQASNFFTIASVAYGINTIAGNQAFATPISMGVGLSSLFQSTSAQQIVDGFLVTLGSNDDDRATSVLQMDDGNYLVVGWTHIPGAGGRDVLSVKYNNSGGIIWAKTFGGPSSEEALAVQLTTDKGYIVTGYTSSLGAGNNDIFVAKFNSLGENTWAKTLGGSEVDIGKDVKQTSDGGYIVTGWTESFGAGDDDAFLLKLDSNGDLAWGIAFGGTGYDIGLTVKQTSDGGYVVAGELAVVGFSGEFLIAKFSENGNLTWASTLGGGWGDRANAIEQTTDGGYIVTGRTYSFGWNSILAKFGATGNFTWAITLGGSNATFARSLQLTNDDGYIITGDTTGFNAKNSDIFITKVGATGIVSWAKRIGSDGVDKPTSIQLLREGGYIVSGHTDGYSQFGLSDLLFLKFNETGDIGNCTQTIPLTFSSISPTVAQISPTVQTMNLGVQNWFASVVSIDPPTESYCLSFSDAPNLTTFPTFSNATQSSSSEAGNLLWLWVLLGALSAVGVSCGVSVGGVFLRKYLHRRSTSEGFELEDRNSVESFSKDLSSEGTDLGDRDSKELQRASSPVTYKKKLLTQVYILDNKDNVIRAYGLLNKVTKEDADEIQKQTGKRIETTKDKKEKTSRGNFGKVRFAREIDLKTDEYGAYVAVKKIKNEFNEVGQLTTDAIGPSLEESKIHRALSKQANILPLLDAQVIYDDEAQTQPKTLYLFMPVMVFNGEEFSQRFASIAPGDIRVQAKLRRAIAWDLLNGLNSMHQLGYAHRDVKPENFMVSKHGGCVIDFGSTKSFEDSKGCFTDDNADTTVFAPERVALHRYLHIKAYDTHYTVKEVQENYPAIPADAFAAGLALLKLCYGIEHPFKIPFTNKLDAYDAQKFKRELDNIEMLHEPAEGSLLSLIKGLLAVEPQQRLTPAQALTHPCFREKKYQFKDENEKANLFEYVFELSPVSTQQIKILSKAENLDYAPAHYANMDQKYKKLRPLSSSMGATLFGGHGKAQQQKQEEGIEMSNVYMN